jgi:tRNA pseudouridine38-40 synthase
MRYFIHIAYQGTRYRGWQRQKNTGMCIQDTIEKAMTKILKRPIGINGCGRTDAGVHAQQYFFHIDLMETFDYDFINRLNLNLPHDIRVFDMRPVDDKAHARFDAFARTYEYHMHEFEHPFFYHWSSQVNISQLNEEKMQESIKTLLGRNDFAHLCISPANNKSNICTVTEASMTIDPILGRLMCVFTANRFLKSMIRLIIARLVAVGEGKIEVNDFVKPIPNISLFNHNTIFYPQGLHLTKVLYPYLDEPTHSWRV